MLENKMLSVQYSDKNRIKNSRNGHNDNRINGNSSGHFDWTENGGQTLGSSINRIDFRGEGMGSHLIDYSAFPDRLESTEIRMNNERNSSDLRLSADSDSNGNINVNADGSYNVRTSMDSHQFPHTTHINHHNYLSNNYTNQNITSTESNSWNHGSILSETPSKLLAKLRKTIQEKEVFRQVS